VIFKVFWLTFLHFSGFTVSGVNTVKYSLIERNFAWKVLYFNAKQDIFIRPRVLKCSARKSSSVSSYKRWMSVISALMATEAVTTATIIVIITGIIIIMIARYVNVAKFEGCSKIRVVHGDARAHNFIAKSPFHGADLIRWKVIRRKSSLQWPSKNH